MNSEIKNLIKRIRYYDSRKEDKLRPASSIQYTGEQFMFEEKPIEVTPTAFRQLCSLIRVPTDFFINRLTREEQALIFTRLYSELKDSEFLFRFSNNSLYGIVSPRYSVMDNITLVDILKDDAISAMNLKPINAVLAPDYTKIRLVPIESNSDELTPMLEFSNSENGLSSLRLWAGVFRLVCSNGLIVAVTDVKSRWVHSGSGEIEMPDIQAVMSVSNVYAELLDNAQARYLTSDEKIQHLDLIRKSLGQDVAAKVVESANREYHSARTFHDLINSITAAAQAFDAKQQSLIEEYAGSYLRDSF